MNSSISDSEREGLAWRRWLRRYAAFTAAIALVLAAAILALDPYDTGRFAVFPSRGVPHFGQRLTVASIARSPEIDAAIIGNSTAQLIDPHRIGTGTGLHMASLAIPGTGPAEQLAVLGWLLRRHRGPALRALVMGIDGSWCGSESDVAPLFPFPFWLYGESRLDYAARMLRLQGLEHAFRKVKLLLGTAPAEQDFGYDDYDSNKPWDEAGFRVRLAERRIRRAPDPDAEANSVHAPIAELSHLLQSLPPRAAVVLVLLPVHRTALPPPGSAEAGRMERCNEAFGSLAAKRPHTAIVDYLHDGEIADRDENFWDAVHYRTPVARRLEADISAAASRLMADE
ncbi:MAG TPA: hypothetical protein VMG55_23115 [Stellaceae bacterium]|nr:hypothetical protein [Stellaceae bacterium]